MRIIATHYVRGKRLPAPMYLVDGDFLCASAESAAESLLSPAQRDLRDLYYRTPFTTHAHASFNRLSSSIPLTGRL